MAKEVAKVSEEEQKALALAADAGYDEYDGAGVNELTQEDKGLPFFGIVQKMSAAVEELKAEPGQIINAATKALYSEIVFVPVVREHVYVEWTPLDKGGGLVATYQLDDPIVKEARSKQRTGKFELPNGNELIETFYLYGLVVEDDAATPAVIPFSSTQIAPYKQIMTRSDSLMRRNNLGVKVKYPLFAHRWRLETIKKQKDKWTWFVWVPSFDSEGDDAAGARLAADDPIFQQAGDLYKSFNRGQVKVNTEGYTNEGGGAVNEGGSKDDTQPPF